MLGLSAEALEKRDRESKAGVVGEGNEQQQPGMRDVLRGLSRVIDR